MAEKLNNKFDVCDYIDEKMVSFRFREQPQKFLPKSALNKVTTREVIQRVISQEEDMVYSNYDQTNLVNRVFRDGRQLFTICVYCGISMSHLKVMLDNSLTDSELPLQKHDLKSLSHHRTFCTSFIANQKHFITVYFSKGLPQQLDAAISDYFSIPIDFEESVNKLKGKGAFGEVWKVQIHGDQRSFPSGTNTKDLFAMKVTQHAGREHEYHRAMVGLGHPHLVKCLTSFTFGTKYHMVYELATCDLEDFMQRHPDGSRARGITSFWLAKQLAGLAGALKAVHNPVLSNMVSNSLSVPQASPVKTGYIHDIKPENILVFIYPGKEHWLRLSDFSCARIADLVATLSGKRDSYKTGTKPGTPTYRAPESHQGTSSRPYDMWSLGCVYLELLVWFVGGYQNLQDFRRSREGSVRPGGLEDEGFYCETLPGGVQLRESVLVMIDNLSRRCSGELRDLVDVIPSLLVIDPKQRLDASQLLERLRHLDTSVNSQVGYDLPAGFAVPAMTVSNNLPTFDSDSDFEDVIKVTRPSDD